MRGDDLRPKAARGTERGELIRATERFAESLNPVFLKRVLQLGHERTFHSSLYVMPMLRILGVAGPLICKPNAAGEANSSVNDQDAPVRAAIGAMIRQRRGW
jgi:hypothetical protein